MYGLRINMTNGVVSVYGCMPDWKHSQVKLIGSKFGGQIGIRGSSQNTILTLAGELVVRVLFCQWITYLLNNLGVPIITQSDPGTENYGTANTLLSIDCCLTERCRFLTLPILSIIDVSISWRKVKSGWDFVSYPASPYSLSVIYESDIFLGCRTVLRCSWSVSWWVNDKAKHDIPHCFRSHQGDPRYHAVARGSIPDRDPGLCSVGIVRPLIFLSVQRICLRLHLYPSRSGPKVSTLPNPWNEGGHLQLKGGTLSTTSKKVGAT